MGDEDDDFKVENEFMGGNDIDAEFQAINYHVNFNLESGGTREEGKVIDGSFSKSVLVPKDIDNKEFSPAISIVESYRRPSTTDSKETAREANVGLCSEGMSCVIVNSEGIDISKHAVCGKASFSLDLGRSEFVGPVCETSAILCSKGHVSSLGLDYVVDHPQSSFLWNMGWAYV